MFHCMFFFLISSSGLLNPVEDLLTHINRIQRSDTTLSQKSLLSPSIVASSNPSSLILRKGMRVTENPKYVVLCKYCGLNEKRCSR